VRTPEESGVVPKTLKKRMRGGETVEAVEGERFRIRRALYARRASDVKSLSVPIFTVFHAQALVARVERGVL
jgi:hypothetical protein